jgi:hypothetical protein
VKRRYRKHHFVIKPTFYAQHRSDLTPVVTITGDNGSQKLILTDKFFPTAEEAEQYGIEMARKWIDQSVDKAKTSRT